MLKAFMATLLATQAAASPPPPPAAERCITRRQAGDLAVISVAMSVETVRNACRPHLPAMAFLATPAAAEYSARLRAEARQRLDSGMAGISRMAGENQGPAMAGMMRAFTERMIAEGAGADFSHYVTPEICRDASEIVEIGSALSPDQMARLFGAFASIVDRFIRMGPQGPMGAPPMLAPPAPPPPAAAPTPRPTPASFDLERGSRRHAPAPDTTPPPSPPMQPFLCRDGE